MSAGWHNLCALVHAVLHGPQDPVVQSRGKRCSLLELVQARKADLQEGLLLARCQLHILSSSQPPVRVLPASNVAASAFSIGSTYKLSQLQQEQSGSTDMNHKRTMQQVCIGSTDFQATGPSV